MKFILTEEIYKNLQAKKYSYSFDLDYKGEIYKDCLLYYGIGNMLYLKFNNNLPIPCTINEQTREVKTIMELGNNLETANNNLITVRS